MITCIELCQDWSRWCLVDWWRQSTTWADFDLSPATSSDIHPRAFSLRVCTSAINFLHLYGDHVLRISFKYPRDQWVKPHKYDTQKFRGTCWPHRYSMSWWRYQMETFSALLAICAENSPVPVEFPTQRPVTRSFDILFDPDLNKQLSKQLWGWWFEMLSCSLWRQKYWRVN